ncbi:MAG: hypothetical protein AAF199_00035 [Pseudomonadota bacterium]
MKALALVLAVLGLLAAMTTTPTPQMAAHAVEAHGSNAGAMMGHTADPARGPGDGHADCHDNMGAGPTASHKMPETPPVNHSATDHHDRDQSGSSHPCPEQCGCDEGCARCAVTLGLLAGGLRDAFLFPIEARSTARDTMPMASAFILDPPPPRLFP